MKTDLFQSCGHCSIFQICWHIECSTFTASSCKIWNSLTGIPSPPLALFIVILPKAHLTSHSRMSALGKWSHHHGYLGHEGLFCIVQFSSVQSLSRVWLFATPWTAACQASLSITNSQSLPKSMSIESVMPSNHLILCCPLLLLPSIFPSIRVFSNESALCIRWPNYWSFSFNISPSNEHQRTDLL